MTSNSKAVERFVDLAVKYINQSAQGHFSQNVDSSELDLAWFEVEPNVVHCELRITGSGRPESKNSMSAPLEEMEGALRTFVDAKL